jgi:FAD/FMN-containing dehydrogenase
MTTTHSAPVDLAIDRLRGEVSGRVITPGDHDYDAERTVVVGGIDLHPAVIVRVADTADVARVVDVARDLGIELAVRSGGHSGAATARPRAASSSTSETSTASTSTSRSARPGPAVG